MNVPKLLRTALFSVFAFVVVAGVAAVPAQAQTIVVDNDDNEDAISISNGLDQLNNQVGSGGTGTLVIETGDYTGEGLVNPTDPDGDGTVERGNLSTVTIEVREDDENPGTLNELTIEALDVDGGVDVNITSTNGSQFIRTTSTANPVDLTNGNLTIQSDGEIRTPDGGIVNLASGAATDLTVNGDLIISSTSGSASTLDLDNGTVDISGTLEVGDGTNVNRAADVSFATGSSRITAPGDINLTYETGTSQSVTGGEDITASAEIPSDRVLGSGDGTDGDLTISGGNQVSFSGNLESESFSLTGSAVFNNTSDFTTDGDFEVSSSELLDVSGTLTVASATNVTVKSSGMDAGLKAGSIDITGDATSAGLLDVDGSGSVTVSDAASDALILDNSDDDSKRVLLVNGGTVTVQNGGTNFNGAGNTVRVQGDANVDLGGDVTFAQADPQFNLDGLSAGTDTGVTVGDLTVPFTANGGSPDLFDTDSGGDFTASTGITVDPVDPDPSSSSDDVSMNSTQGVDVQVEVGETDGDFSLGTITLNTLDENDGTGTFTTDFSLTVDDAAGPPEEGRITAAGSEFNTVDITSNAGSDGTITIDGTGSGTEATLAGQLTNNGTFNAEADVTYDVGQAQDKINNGDGTIVVTSGNQFTVEDAASRNTVSEGSPTIANDNVLETNEDGFEGDGTLVFDTVSDGGSGQLLAVVSISTGTSDDAGLQFPTTNAKGSGSLAIRIQDDFSGNTPENQSGNAVNFVTGTGSGTSPDASLTANTSISFAATGAGGTAGDSKFTAFNAGDVTGNAGIDLAGSNTPFETSSLVDVASLTANSGTLDLPGGTDVTVEVGDITTADENAEILADGGKIDMKDLDRVTTTDVTVNAGGEIDFSVPNNDNTTLDVLRDFTVASDATAEVTTDGSSVIEFAVPNSDATAGVNGEFDPGAQFTLSGTLLVDKTNTDLTLESPVRINGDLTVESATESFADDPELILDDNLIFGDANADDPVGGTITLDGSLRTNSGNRVVFRNPGPNNIYNIVGTETIRNVRVITQGNGGPSDPSNATGAIQIGARSGGTGLAADISFTGTVSLESGGIFIDDDQGNSADFSPKAGTNAVIERSLSDATATFKTDGSDGTNKVSENTVILTSGGGTFNTDDNDYNLTYNGNSNDNLKATEAELTGNVQTLTVAADADLNLNESGTPAFTDPDGGGPLTAEDDFTEVQTLNVSGRVASANREKLRVVDGTHSVSGDLSGLNQLQVGGTATVNGSSADGDVSTLGAVVVRSGADADITDVKTVSGTFDTNSNAQVDLTLADDDDTSNPQTITGVTTLDGSRFTIKSPVNVQGDVNANSGSVELGSNDLTVEDANFAGASGVTYSAGDGFLVMEDDGTNRTFTANGATIPNLRFTSVNDTPGDLRLASTSDGDNVAVEVGSALDVENTISIENSPSAGNDRTVVFTGDATLDVTTATTDNGQSAVLEAQGSAASIDVATQTDATNLIVDASSGNTATLTSQDGVGNPVLDVTDNFNLSSGSFNHNDSNVELSVGSGSFVVGADGETITSSDGAYLVLNNSSLTTSLSSDVTIDRLDVTANAALSDDGQVLTVGEEVRFSGGQFDGLSGDDDDNLAVADGALIKRTNNAQPLTEPPTFKGDVNLEYTGVNNDITSGQEVPSASATADVLGLTVDVNGQTFTLNEISDVATGNVVVTDSVALKEGTLAHDGTGNRLLELNDKDGDGVEFIQRDGSISSNSISAATDYALIYRPDDASGVKTSGNEFLSGSVSTLTFEDPFTSGTSSNGLTLGNDGKSVGGLVVDRTDDDLDLDGNTLTVNGATEIASGEVSPGTDGSGDNLDGTLDSDGTGGTLGADSDSDVLISGTLSSSLEAEGNVEIDGGSVDSLTFDGQDAQSLDGSGTVSTSALTLDQSPPSSGDASTVSVNDGNGTLDVGGALTLNGGVLVADEVQLEDNTLNRDPAAGQGSNDFSHVAAALERSVSTSASSGELERVNYPVGTENPEFRRYRLDFPGGAPVGTDVTVEYVEEEPAGTEGFPITDNSEPPVTIGSDVPGFQWRVSSDQDLNLDQGEYELTVGTSEEDLALTDPVTDHRVVVRDQNDNPSNAPWSLVGNGTNYENAGPVNGDVTIRTEGAGADITELGTVYTVGVPADAAPQIASSGEDVKIGNSVSIGSGDLEATDDKAGPAELTYAITTAPTQGELLLSGSAVGEGGTFTQQDINDGNVEYNHTADPVDDDNFEFEVSDNADQTTSGTFSIDVQAAPTIATNSGLSLTQGSQVPVQTGDLEATDEDNAASELTYEITTAPSQGELLLSGSAVGENGTFTQQDINDGNVKYNHTADPVDDDNFEFEVSDTDGRSVTGTVNVTVNAAEFAISGTVVHPRTDGDSDPVEGATVTINDSDGNVVATPETDTDGSYSTDVAEGNYTLEVTAVDGVPETPSDDGLASGLSVNTTDAFAAQDNFLSPSSTLSPIQTTVGDVKGSEDVVNTTDALGIQRYFLNSTDSEFNVGVLSGGTESVNVSGGDETGIQLEAVAFGDINLSGDLNGAADGGGTQVASALSASTAGEESVSLVGPESDTRTTAAASSVSAEDTETTFEVPVRLDRPAELGAFDLTMSYDSEKATLQGVSAPNAEVSSSSEDGTVRLAWFDKKGGQNPLTVSDDEKLVTLTFKADADVKKGETFELEDIEGQLTGPDAEPLSGVGVTVPQVSFGIERPDEFALEGNAPNPFQSRTTLSVQMPESGSATVSVYNTLGQQVKEIQTNLAAGDDQRIEVDGSGLSSGVYMYRIEVEMESKTIRRSGRMTLVK